MSTILSIAQLTQEEYTYVLRNDRDIIYSAVQDYNALRMSAREAAMSFFVEDDTTSGSDKYQLPMTGRDKPVRSDAQPNNLRRFGSWNVGFPIFTYKPQIATTPVSLAYLTPEELDAHFDGINIRYDETLRYEILNRIFDNTNTTFVDPEETLPDETVVPLANGDSVVYPPILGESAGATENHYFGTNYTSANISDTNNPIRTIVADLIEHFGRVTGGSNIAVLISDDERDAIESLSGFVPVDEIYVNEGDDTATTQAPPNIPGEVIGRVSGAWISVWDWIPSGYMVGRHLSAAAPLMRRVDPAATGLGGGQLVDEGTFAGNAITWNKWMYRFGIGTGNRLNTVVAQLVASTDYTAPTIS